MSYFFQSYLGRIAGWKNDVSHKLHGKFHVGDVILQVNEIMVEENGPEFVLALINSSAKNEVWLYKWRGAD